MRDSTTKSFVPTAPVLTRRGFLAGGAITSTLAVGTAAAASRRQSSAPRIRTALARYQRAAASYARIVEGEDPATASRAIRDREAATAAELDDARFDLVTAVRAVHRGADGPVAVNVAGVLVVVTEDGDGDDSVVLVERSAVAVLS